MGKRRIKRVWILVIDYVARDPAPETDERRAVHK
jgi:translation initiation factor IF-1